MGLRVVTLDSAARTAVIQWNPSQDADRYVVEYWNTFDSSVTITSVPTAGTETTTTLRDLPGTWLSVRVRAGNSAGFSGPSVPVSLQIPVQKDIVEALFFGSGPYGSGLHFQPSLDGAGLFARPPGVDYMQIAGNGMHLSPGLMLAWAGGAIPVRVEDALSATHSAYLTRILAHITEVTGGFLRPEVVQRVPTLSDVFVAGEIRVVVRGDLSAQCTTGGAIAGCTRQLLLTGGQLISAVIYLSPSSSFDTVSHEAGHAIGLHHVIGVQMPVRPVMSSTAGPAENGFSVFEVEALRSVYGSGLRFGATRADFQLRGLIQ